MAQKVKWALKTGLNAFKGNDFFFPTSSVSNILMQNCRRKINGSEILNPLKVVQSKYWFQQSVAFSMTYDEAISKKNQTETDKVIIYFGEFGSKIKGLKVMSYSTSLLSLFVQPYIYNDVMALAVPATAAIYTVLGFFTFVTPLIIHSVTKKYVTEIKYDPSRDSYTLKTLTFFLRDRVVNFKLSDVRKGSSPSLFNTFFIKGKPVIVFEEGFLDRQHYIKMMGYDKPIDLGLKPNVIVDETVKSVSTGYEVSQNMPSKGEKIKETAISELGREWLETPQDLRELKKLLDEYINEVST